MKIAVIQHALRDDLGADIDALSAAIVAACSRGARVVACPWVPSIASGNESVRDELLGRIQGCPEGTALLIPFRPPGPESTAPVKPTPLGDTALLLADECISPTMLERMQSAVPAAIVMRPMCESELQAEAVLEHALSLSVSLSGLVLLAECDGAEFSEPGHGGSAIVLGGEVLAEAMGGDDVLLAEIETPVLEPEPREKLAVLPTILEQRLAFHEGRKPDPGYLADLS